MRSDYSFFSQIALLRESWAISWQRLKHHSVNQYVRATSWCTSRDIYEFVKNFLHFVYVRKVLECYALHINLLLLKIYTCVNKCVRMDVECAEKFSHFWIISEYTSRDGKADSVWTTTTTTIRAISIIMNEKKRRKKRGRKKTARFNWDAYQIDWTK